MSQKDGKRLTAGRRKRLALATLAALALSLSAVSSASALSFEGVSTWAKEGEEVQLGGVVGLAVNYTGAGGVPAGTIYGVGYEPPSPRHVVRFSPGEKFRESWEVKLPGFPYGRCGPEGNPSEPHCLPYPSGEARSLDVDVDQSTGNVYVLGELGEVQVYSPDGSKEITHFGVAAPNGQTTAEGPGLIHENRLGGIAVNGNGEVYRYDFNGTDSYSRLMVFAPKTPGDYSEYEYRGEIAGGSRGKGGIPGPSPEKPVVDATGNIYVADEGGEIFEYTSEAPGVYPHHSTPICKFNYPPGGLFGLTVNPATGEPFFFSEKKEAGHKFKLIHQLGPCEEGEFHQTGLIEVKPERGDLFALAFDPNRHFSLGRHAGVLYGAAPAPVPNTIGKGEPGTTSLGYSFAPAEENPPSIESESVSQVTATSVRLRAEINPHNFATTYSFQYASEANFLGTGETFSTATEVPVGGGFLGEGSAPIAAATTLTGLDPDATYHYRVIASSKCSPSEPEKVCEVAGPGKVFHTYPVKAPGLPDGRAYELVSPAEKNGAQVFPLEPNVSSCEHAVPECKPGAANEHFPMQASAAGGAVVYEGTPFFPGQGAPSENEYISRRGPEGWTTLNLTPPLNVSKGSGSPFLKFGADLSTSVIKATALPLSPDAPSEYRSVYLQPTDQPETFIPLLRDFPLVNHLPFNRAPGEFRIVGWGASSDRSRVFFSANDALTGASAFASEAVDGGVEAENLYEWREGDLALVNVLPGNTETLPGVAFRGASDDGTSVFWSAPSGQTYVRIDGRETLELNHHAGQVLLVSADGSRVLFSDDCLYDLATEACQDLTAGLGGFQGIAGQSEDLSQIYFVDTEVLTGEEENGGGEKAQAGKANLYSWSEGSLAYVATLGSGDGRDWVADPARRKAEASPRGRWLAFLSSQPLTGFDNVGPCSANSEKILNVPCDEAYLYDSDSGVLRCVSCASTNAAPLGHTTLPLNKDAGPQPRYLADSGRLLFDTQNSLVQADVNGAVEDVYEFEPGGVGSCTREAGCVSLLSSGTGSADSNFLAMDETGDNAFFVGRDPLVAADSDDLLDVYDARVGGGFPGESELPAQGCGEGCQPSTGVGSEPPASATLAGPGKPASKQCGKGKVRRNLRCVVKHKAKHHKHRARTAKHARGGAK